MIDDLFSLPGRCSMSAWVDGRYHWPMRPTLITYRKRRTYTKP